MLYYLKISIGDIKNINVTIDSQVNLMGQLNHVGTTVSHHSL